MVKDPDGLHFLYIENGNNPYGVEFGKADDSLCRRKNPNGKNSMMLGQMSFWFFEDEPKRFTLVHTVAGEGLSAKIGRGPDNTKIKTVSSGDGFSATTPTRILARDLCPGAACRSDAGTSSPHDRAQDPQ